MLMEVIKWETIHLKENSFQDILNNIKIPFNREFLNIYYPIKELKGMQLFGSDLL